LLGKTPQDLWRSDLDRFEEEYLKVVKSEREEYDAELVKKASLKGVKKIGKAGKRTKIFKTNDDASSDEGGAKSSKAGKTSKGSKVSKTADKAKSKTTSKTTGKSSTKTTSKTSTNTKNKIDDFVCSSSDEISP